jgi:hypothetical protein
MSRNIIFVLVYHRHRLLDLIDINLISSFCKQPSAESQMRPPLRDVIFAAWSVLLVVVTRVSRSSGIMISRKNSNKYKENLL